MSSVSAPIDQYSVWLRERLQQALGSHYALGGVIGRGGVATVYRATDMRHARSVAVKVLQPEFASSLAAERFLVEIGTVARLVHPHILGLIDSGEVDGLPYYIMPHVEGESLRERLQRERCLPVPEAARIGREVASALAYAHLHGVVHRDVKPENVLLVDCTHAVVTDFGLALAIIRSVDRRKTPSRHIVGTLAYMSPEQASSANVDGRADIYSLGCMLFELLSGRPPFEGDTMSVLAQHLAAQPPRLTSPHGAIPPPLEAAVRRALEKDPSRRFATADELARQLELPEPPHERGRLARGSPARRRAAGLVAAVLLTAAGSIAVEPGQWGDAFRTLADRLRAEAPDSMRIAIFPLRGGPGASFADDELRLHDALARWRGITVVDRFAVGEAATRAGMSRIAPGELDDFARRMGAGRYVQGSISVSDAGRRVQLTLHEAGSSRLIADTTIHIRDDSGATLAYRRAVDRLLFGNAPVPRPDGDAGTTSYAALQAYLRGHAAALEWNLSAADSAFSAAIAHDPGFPVANVWAAQVRNWAGYEPPLWSGPVESALAMADRLPFYERQLARALQHLAAREYPEACAAYRALHREAPQDFAAAYGLAECISADDVVVPDRRTPSRWRFRASRHEAMVAYRAAFRLRPSIHRAFRDDAFSRLRTILLTSSNSRLDGRPRPPDTTSFRAAPSWAGDSLVLIPYPVALAARSPEETVSPSSTEAVLRQQALFRDVVAGWRAAFPDDVAPMEAMAIALALGGESSALDTVRAARRLATDEEQRVRLAAREVWLRVSYSLPDDTAGLALARGLADSLLMARGGVPVSTFGILSGLAALTGRARQAATLAARVPAPPRRDSPLSRRTIATANALLAYAAVGGPVDSIHAFQGRLVRDVASMARPDRKIETLAELLAQSPALAFPVARWSLHEMLAGRGNAVLDAQWALASGDSAGARRTLARRTAMRRTRRGADLTLDMTYAGAWTLAAAGDRRTAIAWLDHVLNAATMYAPEAVERVANAGPLVRALVLRAELARAEGDTLTVHRWSRAAAILWQNADPEMRDVIRPGPLNQAQTVRSHRPVH